MARRLPPRDSKGRFKKRGRSRSRSRKRRRRARRNLPPRDSMGRFVATRGGRRRRRRSRSRRSYRRNPAMPDVFGLLMDGTIQAGQVLVGKAATRSVPDLFQLPKQGNVGLAVQGAVAVGLGWVADMFLSKDAARAILAGGLTAPMETMIVAYQVPWLSTALAPTTANGNLQAYVRRRAVPSGGDGVAAYVPRQPATGMGAYVRGSGGRPMVSSGTMGYY